FEAGAGRVIASLWPVGDRSTTALMTRFYEDFLGRGVAPPAALRAAQLALLAEPATAAPYHWAGFQFLGEWRPPPAVAAGDPLTTTTGDD
ncbi:MAG: CHAT domain-containing protein, partial [Acidobacteria bacterium]